MQEKEDELTSIHDADFHICIFPHLDEFLILDSRDPKDPSFRLVPSAELLTPDYYRDLEREFSRMVQAGANAPFINLMTLPRRLEAFLRRKGMQRLTEILHDKTTGLDSPRVSVFICVGPIIALSGQDMAAAMDGFFDGAPAQEFVKEYRVAFERLLVRERMGIKAKEMDELRRAVQGRSSQFFTLWQDRQGPPSAN